MYEAGLLCKCSDTEEIELDDPVHGTVYKRVLQHSPECEARAKMMEILAAKE